MITPAVQAVRTPIGDIRPHAGPEPVILDSFQCLFTTDVVAKDTLMVVVQELVPKRNRVRPHHPEDLSERSSGCTGAELLAIWPFDLPVQKTFHHAVSLGSVSHTVQFQLLEHPGSVLLKKSEAPHPRVN